MNFFRLQDAGISFKDASATVDAQGKRLSALVEQVRAETQGNIAAFANIDQAINELTRRVEALESVNSPWPLLNETAVNLETLRQTVEFCNSRLEALEAMVEDGEASDYEY